MPNKTSQAAVPHRDEWECSLVHHGGEGPGHGPWITQLLFRRGTAQEAAQEFAIEHFEREHREGCDVDRGTIFIAVRATEDAVCVTFACTCSVEVRASAALAIEQPELTR
jgi:hypothetical protein